jgi:hypothetical protein
MRPHQAKKLRRWIEALLGIGILSTWIVAEIYFPLVARFIIGAICVLAAFYFGWRLERVNTRQARIDASLTAGFGESILKCGAPDRLRVAFERFLKKQESADKIGRHRVLLSDEISVELGQLSKEQKNGASKTPSAV